MRGQSTLADVAALKLRLADMMRLRARYTVQGKLHLVTYLNHVIADLEAEIAVAERASVKPPSTS